MGVCPDVSPLLKKKRLVIETTINKDSCLCAEFFHYQKTMPQLGTYSRLRMFVVMNRGLSNKRIVQLLKKEGVDQLCADLESMCMRQCQ